MKHWWFARQGITADRKRHRRFALYSLLSAGLLSPGLALGEIHDVTVTDVTPRAFAVVWMSDESVTAATIHVYADAGGNDELSAELSISLVSADFPPALDNGVVKVDVSGLEPATTYYYELVTTTASGDSLYPEQGQPLATLETATEVSVTRAEAPDEPIVNDLIVHPIYQPDAATPGAGSLLLVSLPGISAHPISAFVGDGIDAPEAIADLSNLFDENGRSAEAVGGDEMELREFRGNVCDASTHQIVRLRRVPEHEENPPIKELEVPADCFAPNGTTADYNCDGQIGLEDFGAFASHFDTANLTCEFNTDYDFNGDGKVDLTDLSGFAAVFDTREN